MNLEYLGWPYREYIKAAKNDGFCEELISENDVEAVLAIVMTMMPTLLGQLRRLLQTKKIITNALRIL